MFAALERGSDSELSAAIGTFCEHQVDGLVLAVQTKGGIDLIRKLCREVPFVTLGAGLPPDVPAVVVDGRHGVRLAARHLIDLGHKQIACIAGPSGWPASKERRQAWAQTIKSAGLKPGPCEEGDWSAQSGYEAHSAFWSPPLEDSRRSWLPTTTWRSAPCELCMLTHRRRLERSRLSVMTIFLNLDSLNRP